MDIQWMLQKPQQKTESGQNVAASLSLRAGELLTASVLDVSSGTDALLALGPVKAYARLPLPVVSGQEIRIQVESTDPHLRMAMLPTGGQAESLPTGKRLAIGLFEPVSDRPFLAAHARSLKPGDSIQGRITGFERDGMKLVDFGKFKAFAKIDVPVRQGQTVSLTVLKSDRAGVGLTMAGAGGSSVSSDRSPASTSSAVPGDQAGVARPPQVAPAVNSVMPAASATPVAETSVGIGGPSQAPTTVDMAVLREQVQLLLEKTPQAGTTASTALPWPTTKALLNLQQILNPASTNGDMGALVARVRDFIENSGLYFEKHLEQVLVDLQNRSQAISTAGTTADLAAQPEIRELMVKDMKPNLLILKQFLDSQAPDLKAADRQMLEALKGVVQRAVSHIEQQQVMATEKPVDPDLFQAFSHLLFLTDTQRNARLKVYYAKKNRQDDHKHPRVSLLLEMDRMGTVRTDLWTLDKDLNITFFVRDTKIKAAIDAEQHRIGSMLEPIFNTVAIGVVVNQKKIAEFDGEDLSIPHHRQLDLSV